MCSLVSSISSNRLNHAMDDLYVNRNIPELPHQIIIRDPAMAQQVIQELLENDDGEGQIIRLLHKIWEHITFHEDEKGLFQDCVKHLPNAKPLIALMEKQPSLFLYVLSAIPSGHTNDCKAILKALVEEEGWKERLSHFIIKIKDDTDNLFEDGCHRTNLNFAFLLQMDEEHLKKFIKHFVKQNRHDCFAFLLVSLTPEYVAYALKKFSKKYSFIGFEGYRGLFSTLSTIARYPADMPIYSALIKRCRKKDELDHLYFELSAIPFCSRVLLIKALRPAEKATVFEIYNHPDYFCDLLESQCFLEKSYRDRKELFQLALKTIISDQNGTRDEKLKKLVLELSYRQSWMSAYLLVALTAEELEPALTSLTPKERTDLFTACPPDNSMPQLFEDLSQDQNLSDYLYTMLRFDLNPIPAGEEEQPHFSLTEPTAIRFFSDNTLANTPSEYLEDYLEIIQNIPPLILSLGCLSPEKLNLYLGLLRFFTDDQLLFMVIAIKPENVFSYLEAISKNLRAHQYSMIIMNLSNEQLSVYLSSKIFHIQSEFEDLLSDLRLFSTELQESENKPITRQKFDGLFLKALTLQGRARGIVNAEVYALAACMTNLGKHPAFHKNLKDSLFDTINQFHICFQSKLAPRSLLFLQLQMIEKNIVAAEDEASDDIFDKIYPEFWTTLTEGVLVQLNIFNGSPLNITHAGDLPLVGITSNDDLNVIGISQGKQEFLDRLVMTLNSIKMGEGDVQFELSKKWDRFFNIGQTDLELKKTVNELLAFFDIKNVEQELLKTTLKKICGEMLTLEDLPIILREEMVDAKEVLKGNLISVPFARKLIGKQVQAIRRRLTLAILQRYLKQSNLRSCWDSLRQQGIHSLSALRQTGRTGSKNLFKLDQMRSLILG